MDNRLGLFGFGLDVSSANAFQSLAQYHADTTPQINSPGSCLNALNSKGIKRKWCAVDIENPSLVLGLGRPSSSSDSSKKSSATACTMSSAKETDDGSSMDLGLDFDLNLGNENTVKTKKRALAFSKTVSMVPNFDRQLSLSVGASESVITGVAPGSACHHYMLDKSMNVNQVPTDDEGSTSSLWKHGKRLLAYLNSTEKAGSFLPNQMIYAETVPVRHPDFSSLSMTYMLKRSVASTSRVTQLQQYNSNNTKCVKRAKGASGLCIAHGGGRRCQKDGYSKGAESRKSAEGHTDHYVAHGGHHCRQEDCTKAARGKTGLCIKHGGGKRCQKENCTKSAEGHSGLCISHGGGRHCKYPEYTNGAQASTSFRKAHGGGKRCTYLGCTKGVEGSTTFCKAHSGGKCCAYQGCTKCVHGGTQFCIAHGGGKRCAVSECSKSARGRTDFCVQHGGGKRCKAEDCGKSAQGSTDFCEGHGGGNHCFWGQPGSELGIGRPPCNRFARGKSGLCAPHSALVEDHQVHGGHTLVAVNLEKQSLNQSEKMKEVVDPDRFVGTENEKNSVLSRGGFHHKLTNPCISKTDSLPEGRVHGGSLMAMLASNASLDGHSASQAYGNSEHSRSSIVYRN